MKAWDYTPFELTLICEQVIENNQREIDKLIYLAWHTEAFARHKRLPNLNQILRTKKRQSKSSMSDEILKAMAREKGVNL